MDHAKTRDAATVAAMARTVDHLRAEIATFCTPAAISLRAAQRDLEAYAKDLWLQEEQRRTAP